MEQKPETKYYFFDQKKSSYYKNEFLNNCKSRIRYIDKINNTIIGLKNTLEQIDLLESKKDPYTPYNNIVTVLSNTIEELEKDLTQYRIDVSQESNDLLSKNFDEIINNNVEKIRSSENEKEGEEIRKE